MFKVPALMKKEEWIFFQHEVDSRDDSNSYEETDGQNINETRDQSV